jgi:hypothetical protein
MDAITTDLPAQHSQAFAFPTLGRLLNDAARSDLAVGNEAKPAGFFPHFHLLRLWVTSWNYP